MANIKYYQNIDMNKNQMVNMVLHNCTSLTRPTNPVGGQRIYETDTGFAYTYNAVKGAWENASGGISFKGTVGGDSGLANLPTKPNLQDAYYVGADGDYGAVGSTQHALVGDFFFCSEEATSTASAKWSLVPSGNGRLEKNITIKDGTISYTIANSLGTTSIQVSMYDENGEPCFANFKVSLESIVVEITEANAKELDGSVFKLVACAG